MQAGVCLRQDAETPLPELIEQRPIKWKEEDLSRLGSVHMAESETECAAPGLDTLEPEPTTAHSGVSDAQNTQASLVKVETNLHLTHTGDLKMERLDGTELGYGTHLHPDQIKTETDNDVGYLKAEHFGHLQDIKCVNTKSYEMKCESRESSVSGPMNTVMCGGGGDHKGQMWPCAGEPKPNCDLPTQRWDFHRDINNENSRTRIVQKSINTSNKHTNCQRTNVMAEPVITNASENPSLLNFFQKKTVPRNGGEINTGEKPYKCIQCEKCFNTKFNLNTHLRIHTGERPFKCSECGKCFNTKFSLNTHMRIHTGEKPYRCSECEKCFYTKFCLDTHLRIHTGEKPYDCSQCGKSFSTVYNLNTHQRSHTGEKPYHCTQCGKCFSTISILNIHHRIHTGEKPYTCAECGKCFSQISALNCHKMVHTGEKPYKCPQCGKCFATIPHLSSHQRIHTGEKPYKCAECGKCFSQTGSLNCHKMIHTGEKPYKCTRCGKCFSKRFNLNSHQKMHMGEHPS